MSALPPLGLGRFKLTGEDCASAVAEALDAGYRHADTAQYYENEAAVGDGLERSDVPREAVSVATKLWHDSLDSESVHAGVRERRERSSRGTRRAA